MAETKKYLGEGGLEELIGQIKTYDAASLAVAKKYADDQITANKITVDTALSDDSTNPVSNQVLKTEFDEINSAIAGKADSSHSHSAATQTAAGFMSAADKEKLDGIAAGANNYTYTLPSAGTNLGGVKSGGDVTISGGVITVNDDSHAHVIANVDGLQDALDSKAAASHDHDDVYYTQDEIDSTVSSLNTAIAGKAASSHTHAISEVTNLQSSLDAKVPTSRTVNGKALTANITLSASDVSAYSKTEIDSKVSTLNTAINGKEASGTAASAVSAHNTATDAHNDIRDLIDGLTTRLNALANSTDEDLDQMAEIVAYIKSNKSLIDSITTSKVNVSDIIDNLTTNVTNKPLSAAQGVAIKALIDALQAEVESNESTISTHTGNGDIHVTAAQKTNWNAAYTHSQAAHAPSDAEKNQNAFSNVKVGDTTIAADSATDTLTFIAGSNVTLTPNATNDSVTIAATDTVYTHPSSGVTAGTYKSVTVNAQGHVTAGTNPTTLAGYGITDAAAKSHTHTVSEISDLTATAAEINILDGVTATTAELNILDGVTATAAEINKLDGLTASTTELNYVKGVTSAIQSQLDSKASSSHTHNYAGSSSAGGVANSAAKLETARTISLTGDAAGSASFDGSGDASITATVTSMHGVTTAGDGAAYTATVSGITALTAGVSFVMIPHTNSTSTTPTLNVNGLGAKGLRMRGSSATGTAMTASLAAWLSSGRAVQVTYNGIYWVTEVTRPAATDLSGTVAIANGGTGATDADTARANLGAAQVQIITWESTD